MQVSYEAADDLHAQARQFRDVLILATGIRGFSAPYDIPVALMINKLPSGALTAIVGPLLMHGESSWAGC
jgi:hypothetical protein